MKKILIYTLPVLIVGFLSWYFFIALKPVAIPQPEIVKSYDYASATTGDVELEQISAGSFNIKYNSFDGALVRGRITYPDNGASQHPVLVGVSAMGRNYNRWWVDSFKGRPTVTNVDKLAQAALDNGFAVVAIDARYHGSRKDPNKPLRSIMNNMIFFGNKTAYEEMIVNTVKDYRVLLDWLEKNARIDAGNIIMAGYSMGGQISLLTAAVDDRINGVVSIVPPYLDDKVAVVAPKNLVSLINAVPLLLLTSDDDENASVKENSLLFNQIASPEKSHEIFEGSHILPTEYVDTVRNWLLDYQRGLQP